MSSNGDFGWNQPLEDEADDQYEYYTLLNVDKNATQDEIGRAYRRICRIYHPDRYQDPQKQATATTFFRRVEEAYRVLIDPRTRSIYDRSGKNGLEVDMAIVQRTPLPSELLEEYEKLRSLWEERTYIQDINPQGEFQMNVDASALIDGTFLEDEPLVYIEKIVMSQAADAQITKSSVGNVAGYVSATGHSLLGGLQFSLRQVLSNQSWIKVSTLVGSKPAVGLDTYHKLGDRMLATSQSIVSLSPNGVLFSANGSLTRRLTDYTSAVLSVRENGYSVSSQLIHRLSHTTQLVGEARVGYDSSVVKGVVKYTPVEKYTFISGVKVSTKGVSLFYGADQEVAMLTTLGGTVIFGAGEGVVLKLRLARASMDFSLRIQVSRALSIPAIFYATAIPLALYGVIRVLAFAPLLRRQRMQEIENKRAEKAREMMERKHEAEAAIELMTETVERVISIEQSKHGLLILEAWYGKLFDMQEEDGLVQPKVVDVRIPLQCLVVDSKLILHESSKANIPGFYDPCIGEKKHLRVRYEFRGDLHEVTVRDSEPLIIPRRSHRIVNLVD